MKTELNFKDFTAEQLVGKFVWFAYRRRRRPTTIVRATNHTIWVDGEEGSFGWDGQKKGGDVWSFARINLITQEKYTELKVKEMMEKRKYYLTNHITSSLPILSLDQLEQIAKIIEP